MLLSWSTLYNVIFNVWNALNLACWFSFDTNCPNSMFKTYLFLNFVCSAKKASIFFFLWSTLHLVFSMCKVSSFLIPDFTLSLVTQTLHAKRLYSQSSRCSAKEATILISHPNKWPKSWLIWFVTAYKDSLRKKTYLLWKFAKEASILLHSRNNLSIISSKRQISWIMID